MPKSIVIAVSTRQLSDDTLDLVWPGLTERDLERAAAKLNKSMPKYPDKETFLNNAHRPRPDIFLQIYFEKLDSCRPEGKRGLWLDEKQHFTKVVEVLMSLNFYQVMLLSSTSTKDLRRNYQ